PSSRRLSELEELGLKGVECQRVRAFVLADLLRITRVSLDDHPILTNDRCEVFPNEASRVFHLPDDVAFLVAGHQSFEAVNQGHDEAVRIAILDRYLRER